MPPPVQQTQAQAPAGQQPERQPGAEQQGKTSQSDRLRRQRDEAFNALQLQGRQIERLVGAVEKLIDGRARETQSTPVRQPGSDLDPWARLSEEQLRGIMANEEQPEHVKHAAMLQLIDRGVKNQIDSVKEGVRAEFQRDLDARERASDVRRVINNKYGAEAFDQTSEFGRLKSQILQSFQDRYPNDDLSKKPEYEFLATQLAAEHLGVSPTAGVPGSGQEGAAETSPGQTKPVPSKAGPPPESLLSGGMDGVAESISKGREALQKKDTKGFLREAVKTMFPDMTGPR